MKNQDQVILREIQKGAHMGMESIDALMPHIKKDTFAKELARESVDYGAYYDKATSMLQKEDKRLYKDTAGKKLMLRSGIWMSTFMDGSTSHMAEMVIQGANRGITDMYKILNHNKYATPEIKELAKDMMDMEEKTIARLRDYL